MIKNGKVYFSGRGNGHGVGMCQIGALNMANKGFSFREILAFIILTSSSHKGKTNENNYFYLTFSMNLSAAIVVIDPGHGGDERGAFQKLTTVSKKLCPKNVLCDQEKLVGSHQVYLTRSFDKKLTLDQRSRLAQKLGADIFISIHANSSPSEKSQGFETFYLSNSDDKAVKKVVRLENSVAKNEKKSIQKQQYSGTYSCRTRCR